MQNDNATAAEWSIEPKLNSRVFYDDNLRLQTDHPAATWGSVVTAQTDFSRRTELSQQSLALKLDRRDYYNIDGINSNNLFLDLSNVTTLEKHSFRADINYADDTTLTSELETTGLIQTVRDKTGLTVAPAWMYQITPRASTLLSYLYQDVDYAALPQEFSDYVYQSLRFHYNYRASEKAQWQFGLERSEFDVPDVGFVLPGVESTTTTNSANIGFLYDLSESTSISVSLGERRSQTETRFIPLPGQPVTVTNGNGQIYSFSFNKRLQRGRLDFSALRELVPSGAGRVNEKQSISGGYRYRLSEKTAFAISASLLETQPSTADALQAQRRLYQINPKIIWKIDKNWLFNASYRYRHQEYSDTQSDAESNRVTFSMSYQWKKQVWSR